jgi:hypothetical protein
MIYGNRYIGRFPLPLPIGLVGAPLEAASEYMCVHMETNMFCCCFSSSYSCS